MPHTHEGAPWRLFVVQHSHIDIGFTDRQEVIADRHRQFVAQAVEMALSPQQAGRAPEARFKFTCEGFWAVEQFLRAADAAQQERLAQAARAGVMEISAFYLHFTELLDAGHLRDSLRPAQEFAARHGIRLTTAMSCDINGLPWGMADALADAGVRSLCTNINPHHGGFPFERPLVPFRWRSPRGQEVLVWSGLPYHKANLLGLMGGYAPDQNPGIPGVLPEGGAGMVDVQDIALAEKRVFAAIEGLARSGYPYRFLPVMGSGLYTDNSPPTDRYCALLEQWNARHGDRVFIQTATLEEFFSFLEASVPDIPVFAGDWPDWWSDGVASVPQETKILRHAQRAKRLIETLDRGRLVGPDRLAQMARSLAVAAEHTFGYSHTDDASLLTQQVFKRKTRLMLEADVLAGEAWEEVRRAAGEGGFTARRPFTYTVVNPSDDAQTGVAYLPVDSWEQPALSDGLCVRDLPRIGLTFQMHTSDVGDPEGMYAAFPLSVAGGVWHLDRPGGPMRPGLDQLPGTCCDYYLVQDGAALIAPEVSVLLATPDVPLVHIGGLNLWKYSTRREPTGPLYSWLTNNKWETNFSRYCGGLYEFEYALEVRPGALRPAQVAPLCGRLTRPLVVLRH